MHIAGSTSEIHSGIRTDRTAPGCSRRNRASSRVPQIDGLALRLTVFSGTGRCPRPCRQDQVRHLRQGALQLLLQAGARAASTSMTSSGTGTPWTAAAEAAAEPRDIALSGTTPGRTAPAGSSQPAGSPPRPDLTAGAGQQAGNEPDQVPGHVEHDTIGDHAEPLPVAGVLQRDFFYRGLRLPGDRRVCPRVCLDVCYITFADSSRTIGYRRGQMSSVRYAHSYPGHGEIVRRA